MMPLMWSVLRNFLKCLENCLVYLTVFAKGSCKSVLQNSTESAQRKCCDNDSVMNQSNSLVNVIFILSMSSPSFWSRRVQVPVLLCDVIKGNALSL